MEAIVLAGGFGTRLRELVSDVPKPMAPVAGRPFLEILLSALSKRGFSRVVLSLGYMADKVISHFGSCYQGMDIIYEIEESPLGTGGAVKSCIQRCHEDHVYILNGDTFLDLDIDEVERQWGLYKSSIMVARYVQDASRYGRLVVKDHRLVDFQEKGIQGPGLINAGCYVLPVKLFDEFDGGKAFSLENDFFVPNLKKIVINVFVTDAYFIDIGVPEDYIRAQNELTLFV